MANATGNEQKFDFQAEVAQLLHLMVHSVYSDKEIFLRELISNASDACDRLRYEALTNPALTADDPDFKLIVTVDAKAGTITVADNGIGMSRDEMIENLGTIARSGSSAFVKNLTGDSAKDVALIGQFGVGFYSAFMIADKVDVISRRAGGEQAWRWSSAGAGEFTIAEAERDGRGATVILHVRPDQTEFLTAERLRHIVKTYSDHISLPITLAEIKEDVRDEETVNAASAIWARPRKDVTAEQYKEFYHHTAHAFDEPWHNIHFKAEGVIEYSVLLFIPSTKPFDLFDPARKTRVKLYVKRVFITDDCEELLPGYLRFLRGIIDSEDLPLNISREMLQNNPVLSKIRGAVTKRVLSELEERAGKDAEGYLEFWKTFGAVLKEGIYEDAAVRDRLLKLARFESTTAEGLTSLDDYVTRMKDGQESIYFITGDNRQSIARSPQLEGFAARGVEVLLLSDPVDDFWLSAVADYDGKPFSSVTRGAAELAGLKGADKSDGDDEKKAPEAAIGTLIAALKQNLGEAVKDVRSTERLTESPVCLVADDGDMDMHMQRVLKMHQNLDAKAAPILEINPGHELIARLADIAGGEGAADKLADVSHLLLDQARILEGEALPDPVAFSRRMASVIAGAFSD
ncbi:MAG: molecular chaperone HtpG [Sphingomonadales bacterium]